MVNATQFLPQDHLHVMMQLSTKVKNDFSPLVCPHDTRYQIPVNSEIKHRPCRIAPKEIKSNRLALYIPGQIAHFRLGFPYM